MSPTARLSAVSGLAWALIGCVLGYRAVGYEVLGGVITAPLTGILIGHLSSSLHDEPRWIQIAGSLFDLYVAAVCFAVGMGLFALLFGPPTMGFPAAVMTRVLAVLWALTFWGYALLLWPLSFFNHRLVWRTEARQVPTRDGG